MKIKYLFGPKAGQVDHSSNNDPTTHALIRAGIAEAVVEEPKPAPPVPAARFSVGINHGGATVITYRRSASELSTWEGLPEHARDAFKLPLWNAREQKHTLQGPDVPEEICAQYKAQKPHEEVSALHKRANEEQMLGRPLYR